MTAKEHVTITQAATLARDELGISVGRTTVWTWIDQGKLRAVRVCGRWFIPRDALEAILSGQKAACPWPLTAPGTGERIAAPVEGLTQRPAMSCSMPFDQVGRSAGSSTSLWLSRPAEFSCSHATPPTL
jgi:excisionase family DNA binding protein